MTGVVTTGREAVIQLRLRGTNGIETDVEAVIDTGFSESLTLPQALIDALALTWIETNRMFLADGTGIDLQVYEGVIIWDGLERAVVLHSVEADPLIGMSLIWNYLLTLHAVDSGPVTITPIP
jgi:clan AA aspartic protease